MIKAAVHMIDKSADYYILIIRLSYGAKNDEK